MSRWVVSAGLLDQQIVVGAQRPPRNGGEEFFEIFHLSAAGKRQGFTPRFGDTSVGVVRGRLSNGSMPAPNSMSTIGDAGRRRVQQAPVNRSPSGVVAVGFSGVIP